MAGGSSSPEPMADSVRGQPPALEQPPSRRQSFSHASLGRVTPLWLQLQEASSSTDNNLAYYSGALAGTFSFRHLQETTLPPENCGDSTDNSAHLESSPYI